MTTEQPFPPHRADRPEPEPAPASGGVGSVRGGARTVATNQQGPMHSGDGDQHYIGEQHNYYQKNVLDSALTALANAHSSSADGARGRVSGRVVKEEADLLRACFVRPHGFGRAEDELGRSGLVVLSGPRGSGRRAAAIKLLDAVYNPPATIRTLPDAEESEPYLHKDAVEQGELLLLELPALEDDLVNGVYRQLTAYRDRVGAREGYLVVVVSEEHEAAVRNHLRAAIVRIEPPDIRQVLHNHLDYRNVALSGALDDTMVARLQALPVDEVPRLADHVVRLAAKPEAGAAGLNDLVRTAMDDAADWVGAVSKQIERNGGVRQRAVLLSAAMLSGRTTDAVFEAAENLLSCAKLGDEEPQPGLARQGFIAQLNELNVETTADRTLAFSGLNYDAAVRNRFWDDFPDQHDTFRTWVERCARPGTGAYTALDAPTLAVLGQRFAEQHLRTRGPEHLLAAVEPWAGGKTPESAYPNLLLGALEAMLGDDRAAPLTRRRIREWATDTSLSPPVAHALIGLCEKVVAPTHPPQAVVRLRHLARHRNGGVAGQASDALLRLARDSWNHRTLISILADRMGRDHRSGREVYATDRALLREATQPAVLRGHGRNPARAVSRDELIALTAAMAAADDDVREYTHRWLTAFAFDTPQPTGPQAGTSGQGRLPERLRAVATAACDAQQWTTLYAAALNWSNERTCPPALQRRRELGDLFLQHARAVRRSGTTRTGTTQTPKETQR
ncbi:hypothetical protein [Streptomonospora sediminis]